MYCPECGSSVSSGDAYCGSCGRDLAGQSAGQASHGERRVASLLPRDAGDVLSQSGDWLISSPILLACLVANNLLGPVVRTVVQSPVVPAVVFLVQAAVNTALLGVIPVYANRFALQEARGQEPQRDGFDELVADLRVAGARFPALVGIVVLHAAIVVAGVAVVGVSGLLVVRNLEGVRILAGAALVLGLVLGFLCLVVYLFARLSMAAAACVLDDRRLTESISLSWQLSEDNTVTLALFVGLVVLVPSFSGGVAGFVASGVVSAVMFVLAELAFARVYLAERPVESGYPEC